MGGGLPPSWPKRHYWIRLAFLFALLTLLAILRQLQRPVANRKSRTQEPRKIVRWHPHEVMRKEQDFKGFDLVRQNEDATPPTFVAQ